VGYESRPRPHLNSVTAKRRWCRVLSDAPEDTLYFWAIMATDFARSGHFSLALVDRRAAFDSNPKDLTAGLTAEQVHLTKAYVVDALLVGPRGIVATTRRDFSRQNIRSPFPNNTVTPVWRPRQQNTNV